VGSNRRTNGTAGHQRRTELPVPQGHGAGLVGPRRRPGWNGRSYWHLTVLLFTGCTSSTLDTVGQRCVLVAVPSATEARPDEVVVLTGGPFTTVSDTRVLLGGVAVEPLAVNRSNCELCDACRDVAGCADCAECSSCLETVEFAATGPSGPTDLVVVNSWGSSPSIDFVVLSPEDTDSE
jgi:hypothetical protein